MRDNMPKPKERSHGTLKAQTGVNPAPSTWPTAHYWQLVAVDSINVVVSSTVGCSIAIGVLKFVGVL